MPYLALKQAILDDGCGCGHPNAIYIPLDTVMDFDNATGSVGWQAWHDAATLLAVKTGQSKDGPLSQCNHRQQLGPADFAADAAYAVPAGPFAGAVSASLVYVAQMIKDVPAPPNADGSPALNADGTPKMASFFASATVTEIG